MMKVIKQQRKENEIYLTLEELKEREYIGLEVAEGSSYAGDRFLYCNHVDKSLFMNNNSIWDDGGGCLNRQWYNYDVELHVFKTRKELFYWVAEGENND